MKNIEERNKKFDEILEKIKEYNRIIIHGHIRPDGDCIGSQYGMYYLIKDNFPEKEVIVTGEVSEYVSFIGRPNIIADETLFKGALSICVDCATSDRLSDKRFNLADFSIKIDHHIEVDKYGDLAYVDEDAAAACEIITLFYMHHKDKLKLSKEGATALYTGLSTDTGRFKFDCVTEETFIAAANLVSCGVDLSYIDNNLSVETLDTLKLKGYCLSNFIISKNGFAYIKMTRDVINKFGVSDEDAASQVSTISTIEGSPVWALFIEYPNEIRIRLRSRGPEIATLANKFGGGGHAKAAGAKLETWDQLDEFVTLADNLTKEYKESIK